MRGTARLLQSVQQSGRRGRRAAASGSVQQTQPARMAQGARRNLAALAISDDAAACLRGRERAGAARRARTRLVTQVEAAAAAKRLRAFGHSVPADPRARALRGA